jgi:hypothetical protein
MPASEICRCIRVNGLIESAQMRAQKWLDQLATYASRCLGFYELQGHDFGGKPVYRMKAQFVNGQKVRSGFEHYSLYYHSKAAAWVVSARIGHSPFCLAATDKWSNAGSLLDATDWYLPQSSKKSRWRLLTRVKAACATSCD